MNKQVNDALRALEKAISASLRDKSSAVEAASEIFIKKMRILMAEHYSEFEALGRSVEETFSKGRSLRKSHADPL